MIEVRLAKKSEINQQKEIWKLCFGDSDGYINFYYANRYREDETVVLFCDGVIVAMLTMIPVRLVTPDNRSESSTILYAIATHPKYRNRGFAAQIMDFSSKYLATKDIHFSMLVPAGQQLFEFYQKRGYHTAFYIRESVLTSQTIESFPGSADLYCKITSATPEKYNLRRKQYLNGSLYVDYDDEDVIYQKKLSRQSGADIYNIDIGGISGCAAVERVSSNAVLVKELLLPNAYPNSYIDTFIKQLAKLLPARQYTLRTPASLGGHQGGNVRPFGMVKRLRQTDIDFTPDDTRLNTEEAGYLGIAFD